MQLRLQTHELYNVQRWIAALKSGDFTQFTGALANPDYTSHCCLGVLAETDKGIQRTTNGHYKTPKIPVEMTGVLNEDMFRERFPLLSMLYQQTLFSVVNDREVTNPPYKHIIEILSHAANDEFLPADLVSTMQMSVDEDGHTIPVPEFRWVRKFLHEEEV